MSRGSKVGLDAAAPCVWFPRASYDTGALETGAPFHGKMLKVGNCPRLHDKEDQW